MEHTVETTWTPNTKAEKVAAWRARFRAFQRQHGGRALQDYGERKG